MFGLYLVNLLPTYSKNNSKIVFLIFNIALLHTLKERERRIGHHLQVKIIVSAWITCVNAKFLRLVPDID